MFPVWRHHAVFTDSPLPMLTAEADHRRHAIIEQVIADLKNGPLAHLPSGSFAANSAWLVLAAMAFNLTRAVGALAGRFHAKAVTATIRAQLITVAARITRSARRATLRLPSRLALGRRLAAAVHRRDRARHPRPDHRPPPQQALNQSAYGDTRTSRGAEAAHPGKHQDQDQLNGTKITDGASGAYPGAPHVPCTSCRPGSRHLHTGHRLTNQRAPARLIPETLGLPGSDVILVVSTLPQRFAHARHPGPHLTHLVRLFLIAYHDWA